MEPMDAEFHCFKVIPKEDFMAKDDLEKALDSIHQSLTGTPQIDEETAVKMRLIVDEIHQTLARSIPLAATDTTHSTLAKRVQGLISDFEVQHPSLTSSLSLIAERLADMGI